MKLKKLTIEIGRSYESHAGRYKSEISYEGENGTVEMLLDEKISEALLVCIGQTESVLGEIKRHKKGKCVKKYQANVISILPEENEKKRLRIETDLKAAHTIVCTLE